MTNEPNLLVPAIMQSQLQACIGVPVSVLVKQLVGSNYTI
jgi:hypothetical protein